MPSIHVLIILLSLLLGRDLAVARGDANAGSALEFLAITSWVLLVAGVAMIALPACARAAAHRGSWRLLRSGFGLAETLRWLVIVPFAAWAVLVDGVGVVEGWIGSWIALDEALTALPPLLALLAIAWAEHPLHDRMRQAMMVRQLDEGGLPDRPPTRREATLGKVRVMLAMPLIPVLLIVAWHETTAAVFASAGRVAGIVDIAGTLVIVALAPALIVRVLGTKPLTAGSLRDRVAVLCERMGTRVSGVRLWDHPSANAAILGLLPIARYMLMTEPLVRAMPRQELDAVIAHELAHVRQHHVLWIVLSLVALVTLLGIAQAPLEAALRMLSGPIPAGVVESTAFIVVAAIAIAGFGFISRLIERHADARAAVALGQEIAAEHDQPSDTVHPAGPHMMAAALSKVAALNGVSPERWGFRHGSIAQRQRALGRLAGLPASRLPIDRAILALRSATLVVLLAAGVFLLVGVARGWLRW